MKKALSTVLCVILLIAIVPFSNADTANEIRFRGIEWYSPAKDVLAQIDSIPGVETSSFSYRNVPSYVAYSEIEDIDNAEYTRSYTDLRLVYTIAGTYANYDKIDVAGYTATLATRFLFPIVDGRVDHATENAEFYMAVYTIIGDDNPGWVFDDLYNKLSSIYGEGSWTEDDRDRISGYVWTDTHGGTLHLARRYNGIDKKYKGVCILYCAPDYSKRIEELLIQIEIEDKERIDSKKNNTDGL